MKRLYLLLMAVFALTSMVCSAVNYFVPGTVWEYRNYYIIKTYNITTRLVDAVDHEGKPCYQEVFTSPMRDRYGRFYTENWITKKQLVRVEGDKIYMYFTRYGEPEWRLVYDFSLKPGEGCYIKETYPIIWGSEVGDIHEYYFKCVEFCKISIYDTELMKLKVFRTKEDSEDESKAIGTEFWIPGIGSISAFNGGYYYPTDIIFDSHRSPELMKVTDADGDVILERRSLGKPPIPVDKIDAALYGK